MSNSCISTITSSVGAFTNDSDTQLLCHFDGSDASITFTDSSSNAFTLTASGDAQIDTAYKIYGTGGLLLDGTGDYVLSADSAFDTAGVYGTDDWTIEFWFRVGNQGAGHEHLISKGGEGRLTANYIGWCLNMSTNGEIRFGWRAGTGGIEDIICKSGTRTHVNGTWYHLAAVRHGNNFYVYEDLFFFY